MNPGFYMGKTEKVKDLKLTGFKINEYIPNKDIIKVKPLTIKGGF
jgi:hypothetical protein